MRRVSAYSLFFALFASAQAMADITDFQSGVRFNRVARNGMAQKDRATGVSYLNSQQRDAYRVIIKGCKVYNQQGATQSTVGHKKNHMQYVMDQSGNFYVFDEHINPKVRHSSILAGGPVAGAGEIGIDNRGLIRSVDSDSGHYATAGLLGQVRQELQSNHGCNANEVGR